MAARRRPRPAAYHPLLPGLRWRASGLLALLPRAAAHALRLVPLMLAARFRRPVLDREPAGLVHPSRRRRWGHLCERVDFPLPLAYGTARPLVHSLVLVRAGAGWELLVQPLPGLNADELNRLRSRLEVVTTTLARRAPQVTVALSGAVEPAVLALGGVLAGEVPLVQEGPLVLERLLHRAPDALCRSFVLLLEPGHLPLGQALATIRHKKASDFVARWSNHPAALACRDVGLTLEGLLLGARVLRSATFRALRRLPRVQRAGLWRRLKPELWSRALPEGLRPLLLARVERAVLREVETRQGHELHADGVPWLVAPSLDLLRARAARELPSSARGEVAWQRFAHLSPGTVLLTVEPVFLKCLVARVLRSGKLHCERIAQGQLLERALTARARGLKVEVVTSPAAPPVLAARVLQVAQAAIPAGAVLAVEVGERVLLADGGRVKRRRMKGYFRAPRRVVLISEEPGRARAMTAPRHTGLPTVHCVAWAKDEDHACLGYTDGQGAQLLEVVRRDRLRDELKECRELLLRTGTFLSTSAPEGLELTERQRLVPTAPDVRFTVRVDAGGRLTLHLDDDTFLGASGLGWEAAAQSVLAQWMPGTVGRVGVEAVTFDAPQRFPSPLWTVRVRSLVRLRVMGFLSGIVRRLSRPRFEPLGWKDELQASA